VNQPLLGQPPDPAWQIQTLADSARKLAERGETKEAERIYRQILETAPYHVRALNFLATQAMARGELDQSQQHLEQALRAAPERPILHQNLALVHKARGDLDKALQELDRAIALKPDSRTGYLHKGAVLDLLGRHEDAVQAYWRAWRQFPNPELVANDAVASPNLRELVAQAAESIRAAQGRIIEAALAPVRERHGADALKRVQDAADIYIGRRGPALMHALQRPSFIHLPGVPPRAFFDRADFPWLDGLEAATGAIREELRAVLAADQGLTPYVKIEDGADPQQWRELNGSRKWSSYHLFKGGVRDEANCVRCPATVQALAALPLPEIAGHAPEALFSILQPGTHIPPHFGLANYKLVTHLPLVVPADCSIRVGNETRGWTEGQCLVFDDSFQHEAWNRSGELRAVLILDVWNPLVSEAEREGITALVGASGEFNRRYRPA
jgi:aspartate beta-hydroxylase